MINGNNLPDWEGGKANFKTKQKTKKCKAIHCLHSVQLLQNSAAMIPALTMKVS